MMRTLIVEDDFTSQLLLRNLQHQVYENPVLLTGRGTPYGLAMAPVIKVASNSGLARRWHDLIDIDAGRIATAEATVEEVGWGDLFIGFGDRQW